MELFIGIDWADEDRDVYLTNEMGQDLDSFAIENSLLGLDKFNQRVEKYGVLKDSIHAKTKSCVAFCIAIETPHGLMVNALLKQGYNVYPINPKAVKNERKTYRASEARDDDFDAYVQAHMLRMRKSNYTPLHPQSELTEEIRILSEDRHKLVEQKTRLLNQLSACLKSYYPAATGLFSSLDTKISLSFLSQFPTPQDARKLTLDGLSQFLSANGYPYPKRVDCLLENLQQEQLEASDVVVRTKKQQMMVLVQQLKTVIPAIKEYDDRIKILCQQHQDSQIFLSLPSVSYTLAASLIGQLSEQTEFFTTANVLQCYGGTAPVTIQSGKKRIVVYRKACNKFLRHTFQLIAFASLKPVAWAREFYDKQKSKGKSHSLALRNLANQWAEIIFAIWTKREKYDELIYLSHRERCLKKAA